MPAEWLAPLNKISESTLNAVKHLEVGEESAGQRLDNYLTKVLKGAPKSLIYKIIRKGEVRINKGRAKPETRLALGDMVRVPPLRLSPEKTPAKPSRGLIDTLSSAAVYESESLLIVNKPSGLAVHGGSGVSLGLIEALRASRAQPGFLELVHRLDRATSGCVMIAKKRATLKYLQDLLRNEGRINKSYVALVAGVWPKKRHLVDVPLYKREARNGERHVEVDHLNGKLSRTRFSLIENFGDVSLVEAKPLTGRTHQIRVHAKYIGHSLIGDDKYGDEQLNKRMRSYGFKRLFLHAASLEVPLEDGTLLRVEAPLAEDLINGLTRLRTRNEYL